MVGDRYQTQVDLGGLMRVVSDHLYASPLVAVRELVQNAHDSIVRRRRVEPDWIGGEVAGQTEPTICRD